MIVGMLVRIFFVYTYYLYSPPLQADPYMRSYHPLRTSVKLAADRMRTASATVAVSALRHGQRIERRTHPTKNQGGGGGWEPSRREGGRGRSASPKRGGGNGEDRWTRKPAV